MKKFPLFAGAATSIALAVAVLWWLPTSTGHQPGQAAAAGPEIVTALPVVDAEHLTGFDEREQAIIRQLREKYGDRIPGAALQVKVIANLMDLLQKLYPTDWQVRLLRILAAAFPGQLTELRDRYDALRQYNAWLKDSLPELTFPDHAARRQAIWDKRIAVFGEAAREIWALELREEQLAASLKELAVSTAPLTEKSARYIRALRDTYGDTITGANAPHLTQNMTRFLSLQSVQQDLRALPAEERKSALRSFRKDMGLDEEALQRWDALDVERDTARSTGSSYMSERSRLEKQYQGAELDQQLTQLQNRLFGETEAQFIRNEEASGHFRYNTQQTLGVN